MKNLQKTKILPPRHKTKSFQSMHYSYSHFFTFTGNCSFYEGGESSAENMACKLKNKLLNLTV